MSRHVGANCAARVAGAKLFKMTFGAVALVSAALLLAGWRDLPPPVPGMNPADPRAPVPRVGYRSAIGSYKSQRPVEPGPWGEQNQRVAPQPKSPHEGHR
jgi:hypothetical protein